MEAKLSVLLMALIIHCVSSQNCLVGWEQFGNSCYSFGDETLTWIDAVQYCQLYGAHLVHINDGKEDTYVIQSMKGRGLLVAWTGATERLHRGSWEWMPSREPMGRFVNWYSSEPNGEAEDCMVVDNGLSNRWADTSCTLSHKFICEMKVNQSTESPK